ncbi:MAG TPA: hypothetical protein ENI27_06800 [bacterium]|nr:hypothetical protein [bacterium]
MSKTCECGKLALVEMFVGDHDQDGANVCDRCLIKRLINLPQGEYTSWVVYLYPAGSSERGKK